MLLYIMQEKNVICVANRSNIETHQFFKREKWRTEKRGKMDERAQVLCAPNCIAPSLKITLSSMCSPNMGIIITAHAHS